MDRRQYVRDMLLGPRGPFRLEAREGGDLAYAAGPHNLPAIVERARRYAERAFIFDADRWIGLSEFFARTDVLIQAISRLELPEGVRVALLMRDGLDCAAAFTAVIELRLPLVILPPAGSSSIALLLEVTRPGLIVVDEQSLSLVDAQEFEAPILLVQAGRDDVSVCSSASSPEVAATPGEALIGFTSGSTSFPKAVIHSHRSITTGLNNLLLGAALTSMPSTAPRAPPCTALLAPLSYVASFMQLLLALQVGGRLAFLSPLSEAQLLPRIGQILPRTLSSAPEALLGKLCDQVVEHPEFQSLTAFQLYGAALSGKLTERIAAAFPTATIGTGFGMSETAGAIAVGALGDPVIRQGASGQLLPTAQVRFVDGEGSPSAHGAMQVRGPMLMTGYARRPGEASEELCDGWFNTGDYGRLDGDSNLFVEGRLSDLVTTQFGVIDIAKLEREVGRESGLRLVAGAVDQEIVIAYEAAASDLARQALDELLGRLHPQVRFHLRGVETLPTTLSGKVDRHRLVALSLDQA